MADYTIRIISEGGELISQEELDMDYITVIENFADALTEARENPEMEDAIIQLIDNGDLVITEAII